MNKLRKIVLALILLAGFNAMAQNGKPTHCIYDHKALSSNGEVVDLAQFKGKVMLIVNTASKCGFTPQFDGLEKLYQQYRDQGLVVIGFPCNQFANQDPESNEEIETFCRQNYGVTFDTMEKIDVNGKEEHPLFTYLKAQAPSEEYLGDNAKAIQAFFAKHSDSVEKESDIKWNFTKFLVSRDGKTVMRFAPTTEPDQMEEAIKKMLEQ